jgi:hypothetical protein
MSGPEIVRRRGANPRDVLDQQAKWLRQKEAAGLMQAAPDTETETETDPVPPGGQNND